jgi:hypothetical protein
MDKAEIIIYKEKSDHSDFQIEVKLVDDTVWLNRQQMADLFSRDIKTIGKHINNALREELKSIPVIAKFATTAADGKTYQVDYYNLDMILSVGYRVKSQRGIQFRRWANEILKEYLLKGHLLNYRFERIEKKLNEHDQKFELIINTGLKPTQGIFFDGQIFDAWQFVSQLIKDAKEAIVLIDNYVDESVLMLLSKRNPVVKATIYTGKVSKQLEIDLNKHNQQYPEIEVQLFTKSHDRFLIIDSKDVYHIGASLKDLGRKWFAFSKINLNPSELTNKLI